MSLVWFDFLYYVLCYFILILSYRLQFKLNYYYLIDIYAKFYEISMLKSVRLTGKHYDTHWKRLPQLSFEF